MLIQSQMLERYHVWESISPTTSIYRGTIDARNPFHAGYHARKWHGRNGKLTVRETKNGKILAKIPAGK